VVALARRLAERADAAHEIGYPGLKAEVAALKAELAAAKAEKAAPGSADDLKRADAMWSLMASWAKVIEEAEARRDAALNAHLDTVAAEAQEALNGVPVSMMACNRGGEGQS
jgi:hypothetical protein